MNKEIEQAIDRMLEQRPARAGKCSSCGKEEEVFRDPVTGKDLCFKCSMKGRPNISDLVKRHVRTEAQDFSSVEMRRFDGAIAEIRACLDQLDKQIDELRSPDLVPGDLENVDYLTSMIEAMAGRLRSCIIH